MPLPASPRLETAYRIAARFALGAALAGLAFLLAEDGLRLDVASAVSAAARMVYRLAIALFAAQAALRVLTRGARASPRGVVVDLALAAIAALAMRSSASPVGPFGVVLARQMVAVLGILYHAPRMRGVLEALEESPFRMVSLSFVALVLLGTALLVLPAASASPGSIGFVDALFTATSAVCVTGLASVSTEHAWSLFGKGVILALIQAGGLGIMALSASVVLLLGQRMAVRQRAVVASALDASTVAELRAVLTNLLLLTIGFELAGAMCLMLRFAADLDGWTQPAWYGAFHAVSAWNNAGFSLWDTNLMAYASDPVVNLVVAGLITGGGLGPLVLLPLVGVREYYRKGIRKTIRGWGTHVKLVLSTSVILVISGTLALLFFEFDAGFRELDPTAKVLAAFFHSVSARTAGFNTVDIGGLSPVGLLVLCILMFIGASSGSTGGGIKTTTFAVLVLALRASLTERPEVEVFRRRIAPLTTLRSIAIALMAGFAVLFFFGALLAVEPDKRFEHLFFETVSAFGTVGLSTGITPALSVHGKLLIVALMFMGRIGPLTVAIAIGSAPRGAAVGYPEGRILVG